MKLLLISLICLLFICLSEQREENRKDEKSIKQGGVVGLYQNAADFVVTTSGRKSNVLNIFQNTGKGQKWLYRFDNPHGSVKFPHINVNPAVTGVRDPHIRMSAGGMKAVGAFGKVAEQVNKYAPAAAAAFLIYDIYDVITEEDSKKQSEKFVLKSAAYASGYVGAKMGAAVGTAIFPGVGTIIGTVLGGIMGGSIVPSA